MAKAIDRNLGSNVRAQAKLLRRRVKARGTVQAVTVEDGQAGQLEVRGLLGHGFGQGSALQKRKGRTRVQLDVRLVIEAHYGPCLRSVVLP